VLTPHVDRLAATGTLFRHAYVQIAVCSPSRTSFLTGLRPQQSNVLNFVTDFRRATPDGPGIVTLPAYFKAAGVLATGIGKTYHPGLPAGYDEPASWSPDFPYVTAPAGSSACPRDTSPWCSDGPDVADDDYADGVLVTEAIRQLGVINATYRVAGAGPAPSGSNPLSRAFFMAVGLHRPHMDWVVPPSFLARQPPPADIKLAEHPRFPNATPAWAFYNCTELTRRARLAGQKIEPETPLPPAIGQTIRRNYYAAVEYMDSQGGRRVL
jgi:iduronate 2-sulfatase